MTVVGLGGAAYVAFVSVPKPTLSINGPGMPWFVSEDTCDYPSYRHSLSDYDWGGGKPGLNLCFTALGNGKIPYAVAPAPPEEQARLARERAEDRTRLARGGPPSIRLPQPWYYAGSEFDQRVQDYAAKSVAALTVTRELRQSLRDSRSGDRWRAHKNAFNEVLPFVVGLLITIWLLTVVVGWIVRGFAGVPTGRDFRPEPGQ